MWDAEDVWQGTGPGADRGVVGIGSCMPTAMQNQSSISEPSTVPDSTGMADGDPSSQAQGLGQVPAENYRHMGYSTHAVTPPILAKVETQNKWLVMQRVLYGVHRR